MTKRSWATIYAVVCAVGMLAGCITVFVCAWGEDTPTLVRAVFGIILGFIVAPIFHELGHIIFAKTANMCVVYSKFFCFKLVRKGKRLSLRFATPFAADETQVVPKTGGDMRRRTIGYALGGLVFSAIFLLVNLIGALCFSTQYIFWGVLPYAAYLFLLNAAPFEYASGKTDMLVYMGIKHGEPSEKTMLSAMEIFGRLYAGEHYTQIDTSLFFDTPQLAEDEPLYAVMLDLRYRYYLEKNELQNAADCLNRLVVSQEYLTSNDREKLAGECVYMHALSGDYECAEECGKLCREYLSQNHATAKRILAAYSAAFGKADAVKQLKLQAEQALKQETIEGNAVFERILLSRIPNA